MIYFGILYSASEVIDKIGKHYHEILEKGSESSEFKSINRQYNNVSKTVERNKRKLREFQNELSNMRAIAKILIDHKLDSGKLNSLERYIDEI